MYCQRWKVKALAWSTYSCRHAEASEKGIVGIGGSGGKGGIGGSGGNGGNDGNGGIGGSPGTGGSLKGGGDTTGVTGAGTGLVDLGQNDIGWAGWVSKGSTVYISMSNILNMSLRFWAGPAAALQLVEPCPLPETCA